jgi:hypothetical protein
LYAFEDTATNVPAWGSDAMYFLTMDSSGQCERLESCYGGSVGASDAQWVDDEHIVCSGNVNSPQVLVGGVAYQNTSANGTGFIVKTRYEKQADIDVLMLTGNKNQSIFGIATAPQGDIWICGRYYSDTLGIGPFKLPRRGSSATEKLDGFVAKLDQNLKPLFAASIGGSDTDQALAIKYGSDGHLYVLLQTYSKELDINGQPFYHKNYYQSEHLLLRIKDTTSVGVPEIVHSKANVQISPNPADVVLELRAEQQEGIVEVTLTDLLGTVLRNAVLSGSAPTRVETASLPVGIYLLRATGLGGSLQTQKVIIQH